jgi:ABC-type transport system substrate-binding protein
MIGALGNGRGVVDLPVPALLQGQSQPLDRLGAAARLYQLDVQAAKQLLAAAGHAEGISTTLSFTGIYGAAFVQAVQLLQSALREIGVEAVSWQLDYAAYLSGPFKGNFDGLAYGPRDLFPDADPYLSAYYLPGAIQYQDHSDDRELQALITRQQQTLDATARAALLAQIQVYLSEQQYRVYDVAIPRGFARGKQVQNYRATDWIPLSQIEAAWITK